MYGQVTEERINMEESPGNEATARYNTRLEEYENAKATELQQSWHQKTSSLNFEKHSGKLWNLTKSINEDITSKQGNTVIEDNGEFHAGKTAANLLADVFEEESTINIPAERRKEVEKQITQEAQKEKESLPPMEEDLTMAELNDAIRRLLEKTVCATK